MIKDINKMTPEQLRVIIPVLRKKAANATSKNSPYKGWLKLALEQLAKYDETPAEKFRRLVFR